jgi:CDP-diacylglycerol--glycerol-3-phosphate 3-phosphatidyltransferase
MSSLYDLKPHFQELLRPLARELAQRGISANQVTIAALALSAAAGILLALAPEAGWPLVLFAVVQLARMALNAIDGIMAREHGQATPAGALSNEIGDAASDLMLYLPLLLVPEVSPLLMAVAIIVGVVIEVAGLAAVTIGGQRRHDGPMGKSDRAFAFGVLALLLGLGVLPAAAFNLGLAVIIGLGVLTLINRINGALAP